MGVIGIIYEARPNVTSDAAAISLKAGSGVILRGGKEAFNSNLKTVEIMRKAIKSVGLPEDCIQLVTDTTRQSATDLMTLNGYIDVLIPRGGAGLIKAAVENSTVPVIETGTGNCHAFVDASANLDMARDIVFNGKVQRPSVCNALESLLIHKSIAQNALHIICGCLNDAGVEIRGCEKTCEILPYAVPASEEDYAKEFLGYTISVKVVEDIKEAIDHISKYSTHHSEVIITENNENAKTFTAAVDSAAVYVNASTRFTDGGEFGLGAEIGISTQKLHARGPMGLREITSYKYIINGNGQIR
jgi:glutamate-5-semialdehyde dehydrogenase